ncbi:hypothetical protein AXF42_Ash012426 [Apostasia shenzhenica]|uniref:Uncharacterized protein n=1 Tax=Apostasia shenzhenica TaxID=1088818 RepID=A0A2I0AQR2_9ASPA|nr:hypothetical protein AXF42_Ash012426 [Apostasia shenzhenica]
METALTRLATTRKSRLAQPKKISLDPTRPFGSEMGGARKVITEWTACAWANNARAGSVAAACARPVKRRLRRGDRVSTHAKRKQAMPLPP